VADEVGRTPDDFTVLVGAAPTLYPALTVGARGGIVAIAGVVPDLCVRLFNLAREGRHQEALALQHRITPLARSVTTVFGVAGLKAAMDLAGYIGGAPRGPLRPATSAIIDTLRAQLETLLRES
jgi:4-hydroxy-2-oxoglutarate aldolase